MLSHSQQHSTATRAVHLAASRMSTPPARCMSACVCVCAARAVSSTGLAVFRCCDKGSKRALPHQQWHHAALKLWWGQACPHSQAEHHVQAPCTVTCTHCTHDMPHAYHLQSPSTACPSPSGATKHAPLAHQARPAHAPQRHQARPALTPQCHQARLTCAHYTALWMAFLSLNIPLTLLAVQRGFWE